ncbi:Alpha/Beta hydrolase protein [Xylariaceae sp. FL0804]|nr:Alpha/Beta hydrolase protein [Xylariaceae sp. FL0804]
MATTAQETVAASGNTSTAEEIKPYKLHVSSRYLELTQQKLEVTRLPHENEEPKSNDWWQPKTEVEPLIDFCQPFHLVIPSLPGLGFSDALPNNAAAISSAAEVLDALMKRLSYSHYITTNSGSGADSPAEIDYKLASYLSTHYADSCLGTHLISPPLAQPKLREAPIEWAKWSIAHFFHASILGYCSEDFSALERSGYARPSSSSKSSSSSPSPAQFGLNRLGLVSEPNTLAYALCDSPTGLLVFVLKSLRLLGGGGPRGRREFFSPTEIINFTQLAWLPGPESAMRFWAYCVRHPEETQTQTKQKQKAAPRPNVAITVFLGDDDDESETTQGNGGGDGAPPAVEAGRQQQQQQQDAERHAYACPSWARARYNVVHAHRATGTPGLLAWERPELIAAGARGLAAALLLTRKSELNPAPLEQVVVVDDGAGADGGGGGKAEAEAEAEAAPARPSPAFLAPPPPLTGDVGRLASDETAVASDENLAGGGKTTPSPMAAPASPGTAPAGLSPSEKLA